VGRDKKAAERVAAEIEKKIDAKKYRIGLPSFKEYTLEWLETDIKGIRRKSTYERYSTVFDKHIFPAIGKKKLDEIDRKDIKKILTDYHRDGHNKSAVCTLRDICSGPFAAALDEGLISANPITGILKRLRIKREKKIPFEAFTHDEVDLFLETCLKHHPEHYPFFMAAFRTGCRLGELLALKWADVDWNGRFIRINKSYRKGALGETKTGKARLVDLSDQLTEVLRGHYQQARVGGLALGKDEVALSDAVVFPHKGKYMEQNHIRRVFKRLLVKAGLREIRLHDARHTYASQLLSEGVSPAYVQAQLGHYSISITVDIYGHLIPSGDREAVNKLDSGASGKAKKVVA
jgi:integrase